MKVALVGGPRAGLTFVPIGALPEEIVMLSEDPIVNEIVAEVTGVEEGLTTASYRLIGYDPQLDEIIYQYFGGESALYSE